MLAEPAFLLSARYRVGALIVAGMVGVLGMLCASPFANWTVAATFANTFVMLCALNAGYLLGFAISCARARFSVKSGAKHSPRIEAPSPTMRRMAMRCTTCVAERRTRGRGKRRSRQAVSSNFVTAGMVLIRMATSRQIDHERTVVAVHAPHAVE